MAFVKSFTNVGIILLIFGVWVGNVIARTLQDTPMIERYEQWMSQHGRVYTDSFEKEGRLEIFKTNVLFIELFNTAGKSYELAINEFADLTNEEFKALSNGFKSPTKLNAGKIASSNSFTHENVTAPPSLDWRKMGAVTPVKNQGQCGCCWAFSAVGAMEGANKLKTGKLISLSEQELIDCDIYGLNQGCQGGLINYAFDFIVENGGITSTANYPYKGTDLGRCNTRKATNYVAKITGHEDVPANNEKALLKAVARQPVSVAIDASSMAMQFYSSGVFTGDCGTNLDHGVTVVGYGTSDDGTKYWLVKNSWGSSWGEEGYIRLERDVEAEEGLCGVAMQASFPTTT